MNDDKYVKKHESTQMVDVLGSVAVASYQVPGIPQFYSVGI